VVQPVQPDPSLDDDGEHSSEEEALPRSFGKYTLLRKLATGGMAELFLALHRSVAGFEKLIVIKRILPSMTKDKAFIEMLLHEARIAATLSHPNIVQIFDVGKVEDTFFIAMEHIHGEDIRAIVRAMKKNHVTEFPLEHTIAIVQGICGGLAYAHEKRDLDGVNLHIVHRDISPQNIVVTFNGDVKIVDFGIAKSGQKVSEETRDGQLKGKVPYMSPEQASGESIDWRSDIFAAGVMLFELTTGKRLFKGQSEYETLKLICERDYPLPSQVRPGYPTALEEIVMKALAKTRVDRYQSASEMQADLEAFVREERLPVSNVGLSKWMQSLFQDKLTQQNEALQDVKQLADVIVQQQDFERSGLYEASQSGSQRSAPGAVSTIAPPQRTPKGVWLGLGAIALLGASGFAYLATRKAETAPTPVVQAATQSVPAEAPKPKGTIEVKSDPEGCAIWINGALQDETTPASIANLPLDKEIELKLTKEGLVSYRESVTLTAEDKSKTVDAKLASGSVTVLIKVKPEASVFVDGTQWKGKSGEISGLSPGKHKIVLSASGYAPKTITIDAKQGETKTIEETLVKGSAAAVKAGGDAPPKEAGAPGTVRVGAKGGYCNVSVNGAARGPTPVQASVPSGTVRVSCTPPGGSPMSQSVKVQPGQTVPVFFRIP